MLHQPFEIRELPPKLLENERGLQTVETDHHYFALIIVLHE